MCGILSQPLDLKVKRARNSWDHRVPRRRCSTSSMLLGKQTKAALEGPGPLPIDGTKTFLAGSHFSIAISLLINGVEHPGVIACPKLNVGANTISELDCVNCLWCIVSAVRGQGVKVRPISTGARLQATTVMRQPNLSNLKELIMLNNISSPNQLPQANEIADHFGANLPPIDMYSSHVSYVALALDSSIVEFGFPIRLINQPTSGSFLIGRG